MRSIQIKHVIGEMQAVPEAGYLQPAPGTYVRLDFFDSDMCFLGSRSMPSEGGPVGAWPGAAWWRAVVRMIERTAQ